MTWDGVPFFTQFDGAAHPPEAFRTALYAATGGKEGIVGPTDCKVIPLAVPGTQVRIQVGSVLILNRAQGGAQQTYSARNPTVDVQNVTATGSSKRSDLVIARVEDPGMAGESWDDPADPANGPYVFTRIIPNVPAGTTDIHQVTGHENDSAITLARIDIPANTGTILASHITDLRSMANPRTERQVVPGNLGTTSQVATMNGDTWTAFPSAGVPGVQIPAWATHMVARYETTFNAVAGSPYFNLQAFMSATTQDSTTLFSDVVVDGTAISNGDKYRSPIILPSQGFVPIPASLRGTTQKFTSRVKKVSTAPDGAKVGTNPQDYYLVDVTFTERPS